MNKCSRICITSCSRWVYTLKRHLHHTLGQLQQLTLNHLHFPITDAHYRRSASVPQLFSHFPNPKWDTQHGEAHLRNATSYSSLLLIFFFLFASLPLSFDSSSPSTRSYVRLVPSSTTTHICICNLVSQPINQGHISPPNSCQKVRHYFSFPPILTKF
jgi:hypothetical protein